MITIRPATEADVPAMSRVLTASITELCGADHGNDPDRIARWTANKNVEGVRSMLANPNLRLLVAEINGSIAAVGAIMGDSEIGLNYVDPVCRFQGVSKALLAAMENDMRARGIREATLSATATARRFYLDAGWEDAGTAEAGRFIVDQPMRKRL